MNFENKVNNIYNEELHLAAEIGNINKLRDIIKHGADINSFNKNNNTPLILAIKNNHENIIDFLIKQGADINIIENNISALSHAINTSFSKQDPNKSDIIIKLILAGANINIAKKEINNIDNQNIFYYCSHYSKYIQKLKSDKLKFLSDVERKASKKINEILLKSITTLIPYLHKNIIKIVIDYYQPTGSLYLYKLYKM